MYIGLELCAACMFPLFDSGFRNAFDTCVISRRKLHVCLLCVFITHISHALHRCALQLEKANPIGQINWSDDEFTLPEELKVCKK